MARVVYYSGQVQSVGFRATAVAIARRHPGVTGWVRNLPDGRVELLADGLPEVVQPFLAEVREHMAEFIESEESLERDAEGTVTGFRIRH